MIDGKYILYDLDSGVCLTTECVNYPKLMVVIHDAIQIGGYKANKLRVMDVTFVPNHDDRFIEIGFVKCSVDIVWKSTRAMSNCSSYDGGVSKT